MQGLQLRGRQWDTTESTAATMLQANMLSRHTRTLQRALGNRIRSRTFASHPQSTDNPMLRVGLPFVLFSVLASWVVGQAYGGKLQELEASQGKQSKSLRQAAMESEHDEMMDRLQTIRESDFDNTKRIKRPEEILEERRLERERRNRWYRRLYRWVLRKE